MEITEDQLDTLHTVFPDHAIDVFSYDDGLTIKVWSNGDE